VNLSEIHIGNIEIPCRLEILANEIPDKCLDIETLDRPIRLTQETRNELPPLSHDTREKFKEKDFPDAVFDCIGSEAEAEIYASAELEATVINGKDALTRTDINYNQKDIFEKTNLERMKEGKAPLDNEGRPIELHHIGQKNDSPLAELTVSEHRGKGNDNILHNKLKESEINREDFNIERKEYWKSRADQIENQNQ
jgi:hypothetical protein